MRDADDVEHEPVGVVERNQRGESRAPIGQLRQQPRFFFGRGLDRDKIGAPRTRIGERQADAKAEA